LGRFAGAGGVGASGVNFPVGAVIMYGGTADSSPPAGWLLCDGQAVSRTSFSSLFAALGTKYGVGDGSTTFNLPDYVDNFPRGAVDDSGRGLTGGANEVTLTGQESGIQAHSHTKSEFGGTQNGIGGANLANIQGPTNNTGTTGDTNAVEGHENKPPFLDINFLIHV